ncbi:hypothetical protein ABIF66_002334 [Bradyrhizobium japonicum]
MVRHNSTPASQRGNDPRVLKSNVDRLVMRALRASHSKLMFADSQGHHREVMVPRGLEATVLKGTRCYMNLEATVPELCALLRPDQISVQRIERVNAYVSTPKCGAPLHFDVRTVWIVQLFGSKTWMVGDAPAVEAPHRNCVAPADSDRVDYDGRPLRTPRKLETVVLSPGDWLMVPRAVWHRTYTTVGSVSVTLAAPESG